MLAELTDKKITQGQADRLMAPLELDLWALFRVMEEDMITLSESFEGTPEELIDELVKKLVGPTGGMIERSVKKSKKPIGAISDRKDGKYKKVAEGKWVKVTDGQPERQEPKEQEKVKYEAIGKEGYKQFVQDEFSYLPGVLTEFEKQSISDYTDFKFTEVNNTLRAGKDTFDSIAIKEAFQKVKPLSKNVTMFRGMSVSPEVLEKLKNSEFISDKAFTSVTTNPETAVKFLNMSKLAIKLEQEKGIKKERVVLRMDISKGAKLLDVDNPGEQEFLLNSNSKFKIMGVIKKDNFYILDVRHE